MRKYIGKYIFLFLTCLFIGVAVYLYIEMTSEKELGQRQTLMNRVAHELTQEDTDDIEGKLSSIVSSTDFAAEYGSSNVPSDITFVRPEEEEGSYSEVAGADYIWSIREDGEIKGFLVFSFEDDSKIGTIVLCEAVVVICFLVSSAFFLYIDRKVILPFNRLSEYPERIAKNTDSAMLPESRNRYFGKYIWGMNMLRDRLSGETKKLRKLEKEQLTLVSTIAHGIKTPVANIKLYSEAIKSGLYRDDGIPDAKDSEVADKIAKNADDITELLKELLDSASGSVVVFEPHVEAFYPGELEDFIRTEYDNRLSVLRIPYSIDIRSNVLIESDKEGLERILTQLMENAVKYGDGTGIRIVTDKNDDGYTFTVSNKGSRIPESEMPYVFRSFWRGSNAEDTEGNGLGLYEAKFIAGKLEGDISVRYLEETKETEFEVFLPL